MSGFNNTASISAVNANTPVSSGLEEVSVESLQPASGFADAPLTISDTGVPQSLLEDLFAKHLMDTGISESRLVSESLGVCGKIVDELVSIFKADGRIEIKGPERGSAALRFLLTDSGGIFARDALLRSGYRGRVPITSEHYRKVIESQSVRHNKINSAEIRERFSDIILRESILDQFGAAMNSAKALFIYGHPGTGKTYCCKRLSTLLGGPVLVPHAVSVGESIVSIFDPLHHREIKRESHSESIYFEDSFDQRFSYCERPFITSGGELTAEDLEIKFDDATSRYQAPIHIKATNGMYLIDDLGRQKMSSTELFNRWIVPMESGEDYLSLRSGNRMIVPFDLILIFSTNLNPADLADAAFLRRIGHKIQFDYLEPYEYRDIWRQVCNERNVSCSDEVIDYVIYEKHSPSGIPLLACHPRDLVDMALDFGKYNGVEGFLDYEYIEKAWDSNFVNFNV